MDWKKELTDHFENIEFFPAVSESGIRAVEKKLKIKFNRELRSLFKATDGFLANLDANICWSICETEMNTDLCSENQYIIENNAAPENFDFSTVCFFGDDGADIFWGYQVVEGKMTDVLISWNRMKNSIREYKMPLKNFFRMVAES
ncbi:MAG: SMI1/KNR4 family protein [bacterium]|nr:SMI1/KNR4 family protein [bacterium]